MNSKTIIIILVTSISTLLLVLLFGVLYLNYIKQQAVQQLPPVEPIPEVVDDETAIQDVPDVDAFNAMDFPDTTIWENEEYATPDSLPIQVSAGDEALEEFLNAVVAYENQLLKTLPPAMYAVQEEAGRGNFVQMFRNIEIAIIENERAQIVNDDLKRTQQALQDQLTNSTTIDANTRAALEDTLNRVTPITTNTDQLIQQLDQVLVGAVPSQSLLTEVDQSQTVLSAAWIEFVSSLEISMELLRQTS